MTTDLRSDTVTKPTAGMRAAMAEAEVGDDVYGEDPTVTALERRVADLLGHEAGLYCVTGSLANVLGVRLLVEPGQEVVCDVEAHIARAEMGAHAALNGLTMRTFGSDRGRVEAERVAAIVSPDAGPYLVSTAAVAVENTHNFGGGTVQDYDELRRIRDLTREHALGFHLDGARLANAHIATGIPLADYGRLFDTATLCLSKGLGAPIGTVLVSTADNIARARISRKRFGAGWRQAGILAAAGLYALDHQLARLADDHAAARAFADEVVARVPSAVSEDQVQTNIVVLDTGPCPAAEVAVAAARAGVLVSALGRHVVRAVAHLGVTVEECRAAGAVVGDALSGRAAA